MNKRAKGSTTSLPKKSISKASARGDGDNTQYKRSQSSCWCNQTEQTKTEATPSIQTPSSSFTKSLRKCPSYEKIYDWDEHIRKFDAEVEAKERLKQKSIPISKYICDMARKNKLRMDKTSAPILRPLVPVFNDSHKRLKRKARETFLSRMTRDWRKLITERIPLVLLEKHPIVANDIFLAIDDNYAKTNLIVGSNQKIRPLPNQEVEFSEFQQLSYNFTKRRTDNYPQFLSNREFLQKELCITRPLFLKLQRMCERKLPETLIDFSVYKGPLRISFTHWYPHMEETIALRKKVFIQPIYEEYRKEIVKKLGIDLQAPIISEPNWIKYIVVAKKFIHLRVSELLARTVQNLLDVLDDEMLLTLIDFELNYNDAIELTPSIGFVYQFYHNVLNLISTYSQKLIPECRSVPVGKFLDCYQVNVILPKYMLAKAENDLNKRIQKFLEPINRHIEYIQRKFKILIDTELWSSLEEYFKEEHTFNEVYEQVDNCKEFSNEIDNMEFEIFFHCGTVKQNKLIDALHVLVDNYKGQVVSKLLTKNDNENREICQAFEQIVKRALKVPKNIAELVDLGAHMLWINGVYLEQLKERMQNSLQRIFILMEISPNTQTNLKLNSETLTWLTKLKPILAAHNSMFETRKSELEEELHHTLKNLEKGFGDFQPRMDLLNDMSDISQAKNYCKILRSMTVQLQDFDRILSWANEQETLLKVANSSYQEFDECKDIIYPFYNLVYLCFRWHRHFSVWMDGPWENIIIETVEQYIDEYNKKFQTFQKTYRNKIRQQIAEKNPKRFRGILDDQDFYQLPAPLQLTTTMLQTLKDFKPIMSLITIMRNPALLQRHWDEMSTIAGEDMTPNAGTTLRKIVNKQLDEHYESFEIVSVGATKELALKTLLLKMKSEWVDICFKTMFFKDSGTKVLSGLDDVFAVLDDHITKTLSMRGSAFVKPIESEVRDWYAKITRLNTTLDYWGKVQVQWCYSLPIFSSKDIVNQMPQEGSLFKEVDAIFKRYMQQVERDSHVLEIGSGVGVLEAFYECLKMLDKINEGVTNYLEKKRLFFPRFFFLSNDEMLEILSETKDPLRVQPHLRKCFEGICRLYFDKKLVIHSMFSQEGENVKFLDTINTEETHGAVEKWLVQVETQMLKSIRNEILLSLNDYSQIARIVWVTKWEGQVVLAVSQIFWGKNAEYCLRARSVPEMANFHSKLVEELNEIVRLVRSPEISNLVRITIKALIVIDVHAKDVIQMLVYNKVDSINDFEWLSQLRYYWDNNVLVKIINAVVDYAYEYLGNSDRLVITPLTDRCYRTLVGAYQLHLNGAPEGPAGTGKTETTKDLAKAIAIQCVVFNCSDGLDYKAMGKFFKGLASSGAWACFDEFNRIELEVLSVVAQQILCIIQAVRANLETFDFEGTILILKPTCYVCITMNPGYAGRSELPDNLKVLFRTVAMMVPDYALIGEISLYSYGFVDARKLSVKIVQTYRLCSEQLSSQNHYDYGMRAVKTVLSAAGNNKLAFPDENEDVILLRSIQDVNLPKFLSFDVPLFEGIISDLFPGITLPKPDYTILMRGILEICAEKHLQPVDTFLLKIIQTYEMMIVRHGFMLVGEPFGGKSSCLQVLAETLTSLYKQGLGQAIVESQTINPKSITMGQLYGQFDPVSYDWSDGVVATCFRRFAMDPSANRKWVIFDGPVDAVWIENMNTVLDDNKKLCLMSGEVIAMTGVMSMIFEVMDLSQASPATVSRCGMIYSEPINVGWHAIARSWVETANPVWTAGKIDSIMNWLEFLIPPLLHYARKYCKMLCFPGEINLVKSTLTIVEMLMNDAVKNLTQDSKHYYGWILGSLITGISWGIGGTLDTNSQLKFDEYHKSIWSGENKELPLPPGLEVSISLPGDGLYIDYYFIYRMKGNWKYLPDDAKSMPIQESKSLQQTLVPTLDVLRTMFLLNLHIRHKKRMLLVGSTGTGKTFYIQNMMMKKLSMEEYEPSFITFTVQISANQTQSLVISKLVKWKRGIYGPTKGKHAVIFVDDINLPVKEIYGAQPPIELLRQYFDHGHWYDLKDTTKLFLRDIMFLAAMGPVGGSRQEIYQRFLCHFNVYSINPFSDESMFKIFTSTLMQGLKQNGFASDIMMMAMYTVNATTHIYKKATDVLRPTPTKSHYIFNLRDFSRVIQGCAMMRKESAGDDKTVFIRLWVHEVLRVFYDRLVDDVDREWFFEEIKNSVTNIFKANFKTVFEEWLPQYDGKITEASLKDLLFGCYLDLDSTVEERKYEQMPDMEVFMNVAVNSLEEYNNANKTKMNIVLFRYALEHLSKICRILSMPCGCGLLVGVGGSGRQSLTRLAATICGYPTFQPEITKNYNVNEWREDIKRVLKQSGGLGKDTVFLFNEGQIKEEIFLQDIDGLLNSGEVPNIYAIDERQEILELTRLAAQGGNRALDVSALEVFSFFTNRCKEKTHIILCFSPIGSALRIRLRLYPAFVNCCTIDWFEDWPENALEMVAERYMTDVELDDDIKQKCVITCKYFHVGAREVSAEFYLKVGRKTYITSASYLDLIRCFTRLYNTKQNEIMSNRNRYIVGLDQLAFAAEQIAIMQIDLNDLKPKLVEMAITCTAMMKTIEKETVQVEKTSALVRRDEEAANIQAASAQALKSECEADLAEALPVLEAALSALDTLKPADITLVKSMKNPPETVKLVMAAVCVMKGVQPEKVTDMVTGKPVYDYWGPSKRILGDMNFLQSLKDYNKDNIPDSIMVKIRKDFLTQANFDPKIVAKASTAAEGLCKWIIAVDKYDKVIKVVAPKKEKLAEAEAQFNETMALLNEKRTMLRNLEETLAKLNVQLADANAEMTRLRDEVKLCTEKLTRAEKLIGGLGGEKTRWIQAAENLLTNFQTLSGDILLSCGVIAYLSPLNLSLRNETVENWHKYIKSMELPTSNVYSLREILGNDVKIQSWYINGLPNDSFSTDNAIIQDISKRYSLLIDPQGQANNWIRTMEKKNKLVIVKFTNPNYMKVIEHCIEFGQPVLIENILETLEAPVDPILERKTFFQAGVEYIALGDTVLEIDKNFKLYMTTTLRNPHYLPEVFNKVTIINFSLTIEGLQDQLLGIVVAKERPDLQEMREKLIIEGAENKKKLKEVETLILKTLSETEGNILEDQTAIDILDSSKRLSQDIIKKQTAAVETEAKIESSRLSYHPMADHSAILYYCIADLPNVDPMYQYSLAWFINLYIMSITNASKSNDLEKRLKFLISTFDYDLYQNVCRSLFEKDKLLFSFILCTKLMMAKQKMDFKNYMWFLTGGASIESTIPNPAPEWLNSLSWNQICQLEELKTFRDFRNSFVDNINNWHSFYDRPDPQNAPLPDEWDTELTPFEKLTVLRVIRPDKVQTAIAKFVSEEMGQKFISPPPFDIAKSYNDSTYQFPLIFILSPGVDPMSALQSFAEKMSYENRFQSISLGQGQGPIAAQMIADAQLEERWVCLQNCHLAVSWMSTLERICESFDSTNTRLGFRLWLTSYPSDKFPIPVLQNGVKMTNEPPQGLTNNLLKTYKSEPLKDNDFYAGCPEKDQPFHKLLYGMAFFHAVIQERRTFGPIGWNIAYGFNESDFQISVLQLQRFINEYASIPFVAIKYLAGECNYGGRVTDDWDRRCLNTILADFINANVIQDAKYLFVKELGPTYCVPRRTEYEMIISFIQQLPAEHPPEVVGLHMNAGIRRDYNNSMLMLDSGLLVQGKGGGSGGGEDEVLTTIIKEILSKIPKLVDLEQANNKYPTVYTESMNTVLCQELQRFNRLLNVISSTLNNVNMALQGLVVMSPDLEIVVESLLIGKVPAMWAKVSYPSLKTLSSYISDFCDRMKFLNHWLNHGKPDSYWLSGFFFTQAFLTGAKQNYARKYKIAIDQLTFDFFVLKSELGGSPQPEDGVHCYGMFLEGARWSLRDGYLIEQRPKVLYETLPCVWFLPIQQKNFKERGRYHTPLYKTSERKGVLSTTGHSTNYVLPLLLETKKPVSHWVKRSVALLCQLD